MTATAVAIVDTIVGDAVIAIPSEVFELPVQVLPQLALHSLGARAGAVALVLNGEHVVALSVG